MLLLKLGIFLVSYLMLVYVLSIRSIYTFYTFSCCTLQI